jgi:hypothetical protein
MKEEMKKNIENATNIVVDAALKYGGIQIQNACLTLQQYVSSTLIERTDDAESTTPEAGKTSKEKGSKGKA